MTLEDRVTLNEARRWQYLPVRIETNRGRLQAYEAELARLMDAPHRDYKRIHRLRDQIAGTRARLRKLRAERRGQ